MNTRHHQYCGRTILIVFVFLFSITGCGTLEVGVEPTATPSSSGVASTTNVAPQPSEAENKPTAVVQVPATVEVEQQVAQSSPEASATSSVSPVPSDSITAAPANGPWRGEDVGGLRLIVDRVEVIRTTGTGRLLRLHMTVENGTNDSITLPLYGYFVAVDDRGRSYEADSFASSWPKTFPAGMNVSGSADLEQPIPDDASTLAVSFTQVFGSLDIDSISVKGVAIR